MLVGVVAIFDVFVIVCVAAIVAYFVVLGGAVEVAVIVVVDVVGVVDVTLVLAGNLKQLLLLGKCFTKITFFFVLQSCFSKSHIEQYIT